MVFQVYFTFSCYITRIFKGTGKYSRIWKEPFSTKVRLEVLPKPDFNTYFNQGSLELAKYVTQVAEEELPSIEKAVEYAVQRRLNIVVYNNYDDYKASNIGLGIDWQGAGGLTKLVNNKIVLYFDGNKNTLKRQVRRHCKNTDR